MHQDIWHHVIEFSHPINVLASLVGVNRAIYQLVEECVVPIDEILKCDENSCGCKISIDNSDHDQDLKQMNKIKLLGNVKYFVRMYLLHLAFKLRDLNPLEENSKHDLYQQLEELELLSFYRARFSPHHNQSVRIDNEAIKYLLVGERKVGKRTFFKTMKDEKGYSPNNNDFIVKLSIKGEEELTHQIIHIENREQYLSSNSLLKSLNFIMCFSMKNNETFEELDTWFTTFDKFRCIPRIGIIIGLFPNVGISEMVNPMDAVKKAFHYGKSIVAQVSSREKKNIYVPFWFIHLQFTYFQIANFNTQKKIENNSWNCNLM